MDNRMNTEIIAGSCVNGGEYLRHDGPSVAPLKWIMSECVGAARLPRINYLFTFR